MTCRYYHASLRLTSAKYRTLSRKLYLLCDGWSTVWDVEFIFSWRDLLLICGGRGFTLHRYEQTEFLGFSVCSPKSIFILFYLFIYLFLNSGLYFRGIAFELFFGLFGLACSFFHRITNKLIYIELPCVCTVTHVIALFVCVLFGASI